MTKLTLQEQMLKAGLVSSKKMDKVQRTAKKSRVQAREARAAVEENKKAQLERDRQLNEQQKQAVLSKEYKAQVKQLIESDETGCAGSERSLCRQPSAPPDPSGFLRHSGCRCLTSPAAEPAHLPVPSG